jgi:hypothetical protein
VLPHERAEGDFLDFHVLILLTDGTTPAALPSAAFLIPREPRDYSALPPFQGERDLSARAAFRARLTG